MGFASPIFSRHKALCRWSMILLLAVLLVAFLCTGVSAADITVSASVSNAGVIASGVDSENNNEATVMANVPVSLTGQDSYTVNDVLVALHDRYYTGGSSNGYATNDSISSVTKLWGVSTTNTLFFVNGVGLLFGVGTDTVEDGDTVTASVNKDPKYFADWYAGFNEGTKTVVTGESFELTLNGYLGMAYTEEDKTSVAIPNATVGTVSTSGFTPLEGKTTAADGKVSLSFEEPGTYIVSAQGTAEDTVTDWNLMNLSGGATPVYGTMDLVTYESTVAYTDNDYGNGPYPASEVKYVDFSVWRNAQDSYNTLRSNQLIAECPLIAPVCVVKVVDLKVTSPEATEYAYATGDTPVELTVNATPKVEGGTFAYQWRYKESPEATESSSILSSSQTFDLKYYTRTESIRYYYCHVTYTYNEAVYEADSPLVKVSVIATKAQKPTSWDLVDGTYVAGSADIPALDCVAGVTDGGTLSYQWYVDSGDGFEAIPDATARSYTPSASSACTKKYYCLITNSLDSITGDSYKTTVKTNVAEIVFQSIRDYGADWDGDGTAKSPFLITKQEDLSKMAEICNEGFSFNGFTFQMTEDITLPAEWTPIGIVKGNLYTGTKLPFSGTFDGNGKTLTVPEDSLPLLGFVRGATVKNLNIYGTKIASNGLVAYYVVDSNVDHTIDIINCTLKSGSSTLGSGFIGGGASGINTVTIRDCTVEKDVIIGYDGTASNIGSFGGAFNGNVIGCVSYATVKGVDKVGGIVGIKGQSMGLCDIHDCAFYGNVIATGEFAGGILGSGYTAASAPQTPCVSIRNCYSTGSITGANNVGGIFGGEGGNREVWNNGVGYIQNNYFAGTVTATNEDGTVGGVIGFMRSLGRYNIISNNYFVDSCGATQGIGKAESVTTLDTPAVTEGTGWASIRLSAGTIYGRDDDPMGAGAAALAAAIPASELTDGKLLTKLNNGINSSGDWVQGSAGPEFGGQRHLLTISNRSLSSMAGASEKVGTNILDGKDLTLTYSDGSTEEIDARLAIRKYTSTNNTMVGTSVADSVTYNNHQLVFKLEIKAGTDSAPEPNPTDITVDFTLMGDSSHGESNDTHTLVGDDLETWISKTSVTVPADSTVMDVLAAVFNKEGYVWKTNAKANSSTGGLLLSVTTPKGLTLAEGTNGVKSGWLYTLNESHTNTSENKQRVANGDAIVLHYSDDYTAETGVVSDEAKVKEVKDLIDALPATVSLADEKAITDARSAYDKLTDVQKELISATTLTKLLNAEAALAQLKAADDNKVTIDDMKDITNKDAWYYPVVAWSVENSLFKGDDKGNFNPSNSITRAEFAQMIYNYYKDDATVMKDGEAATFSDVAEKNWYYEAVTACAKAGIIQGYDGNFKPDDPISRQDVAIILMRVIIGQEAIDNVDVDARLAELKANGYEFADFHETSSYAQKAMASAAGVIFFGNDKGQLQPKENISRAETAQVMYNYLKK